MMEEKKLDNFTEEAQRNLKLVMAFMVNHAIVEIKRCGEDRELVLTYVDGTVYAVDMKS